MGINRKILDEIAENSVTVVGIPCDEGSSFMQGAAAAPPKIREALYGGSANFCSEDGIDLGEQGRLRDLGDLEWPASASPFEAIESCVDTLLLKGARVLLLGGDHAITPAVLRAYHKKHGRINLLQFDAHPDLYDEFDGSRNSHACPFARIMEEQLVKRLVQVGIRTMNPHQRRQAERFGVEVVDMRAWQLDMRFDFDGPLYISFDMDALDPAYAPGVSHYEPGGLSTREALCAIQGIGAPVIGADIVEFNPWRDSSGMTAMVAAKLLKELASKMLS
ncbi:MAG: agmatinase [Deltaproteobacteria bacterium]|nr:agmatinase [Deltaproteobacteria bacterium]